MDWLKDQEIWTILSPNLAQEYRVLPLGRNEEVIRVLAGDVLSPEQQEKIERVLSLRLGMPVVVEDLSSHPSVGTSGFNDLLDRYYGTCFPATLSQPVASDLMTVLVIDADEARRQKTCSHLQKQGYRVLEACSADDALCQIRQSAYCPKTIFVPSGSLDRCDNELKTLAMMLDAELQEVKQSKVSVLVGALA